MSDSQKDGWRYAVENAPRNVLKLIDRTALAVWVVAEDLHRKASMEVERSGMLAPATKGENAAIVQSPYLSILNRQSTIIMRACAELGFSPTARPRLGATSFNDATSSSGGGNADVVSLEEWLAMDRSGEPMSERFVRAAATGNGYFAAKDDDDTA